MRANQIQIGGDHYKEREIQHWDIVDRNGIGYLEAVATKYLCRHKDKAGVQDLKKAEHYVVKLLEEIDEHGRRPRGSVTSRDLRTLKQTYKLEACEYGAVALLLTWDERDHVKGALEDIQDLLLQYESEASPAS